MGDSSTLWGKEIRFFSTGGIPKAQTLPLNSDGNRPPAKARSQNL